MELLVTRNWKKQDYTIGRLYVNGENFCNTLEPPMKGTRLHPKGAIPAGRYEVTMNIISPKYSKRVAYDWCKGRLPRLLNVPKFDGILIHAGNSALDTKGCILVGENKIKGRLVNSQKCLKRLWSILEEAHQRRERIEIVIE